MGGSPKEVSHTRDDPPLNRGARSNKCEGMKRSGDSIRESESSRAHNPYIVGPTPTLASNAYSSSDGRALPR